MILSKLCGLVFAAVVALTDPITFEYAGQTDAKGQAFLVIKAGENVREVTVEVRGDGKTIKKDVGDMKAGSTYRVVWKQSAAQARYEFDVRGKNFEATGFAFEVVKGKAAGGGKPGIRPRTTYQDVAFRRRASFETATELTSYKYEISTAKATSSIRTKTSTAFRPADGSRLSGTATPRCS